MVLGAHKVRDVPGAVPCKADLLKEVCHEVVAVAATQAVHSAVVHCSRVVESCIPGPADVIAGRQGRCCIWAQLHIPAGISECKVPSDHPVAGEVVNCALA